MFGWLMLHYNLELIGTRQTSPTLVVKIKIVSIINVFIYMVRAYFVYTFCSSTLYVLAGPAWLATFAQD